MVDETTIDSGSTQAQTDTDTTTPAADETTPSTETDGGEATQDTGDTSPDSEEAGELLGAPEEYAEFDISTGEDVGYAFTTEQSADFKAWGKEYNIDDKQMKGIVELDIVKARARNEANNKFVADYKADGIAASRKEHGEKYPTQFDKNKLTYEKFFDEKTRKSFDDMGVSNQPGFHNALNAMTAAISEDRTVPGDGGKQNNRSLKDSFSDLNKT